MNNLILLLLLLPFTGSAQKIRIDQFASYMNAQVNLNEFSGNVLVAQNGQVIYEKAFGLSNRELNTKNNLKSKFQIGSVIKQFTACAILKLDEAGKLRITDTIGSYFPNYAKGDSLTRTYSAQSYLRNTELYKHCRVLEHSANSYAERLNGCHKETSTV